MRKSLFGSLAGGSIAVNVVSNLVNKNVVKVEVSKVVNVAALRLAEKVGTKEHA
ncbi:MAG: hypothetical protein QOE70_4668 [Chthoniobacter sp.]|jgi:hypothetical protein|nr:hypothetical protein [Chthoniobacter sp.]